MSGFLAGYLPGNIVITGDGSTTAIDFNAQLQDIITKLIAVNDTLTLMENAEPVDFDTTNLETAIATLKTELSAKIAEGTALQQQGLVNQATVISLLNGVQNILTGDIADQLSAQVAELETLGTQMTAMQASIVSGFADVLASLDTKHTALTTMLQSEFDESQALITGIKTALTRRSIVPIRKERYFNTSATPYRLTIPANAVQITVMPTSTASKGFTVTLNGETLSYGDRAYYASMEQPGSASVVYKNAEHVFEFPVADTSYHAVAIYEPGEAPVSLLLEALPVPPVPPEEPI
jgi:hypothetical protein